MGLPVCLLSQNIIIYLIITAVILVFETGASADTATEDSPGIFNLCVEDGAGTTANQLEASVDVTLTFSGKGGM